MRAHLCLCILHTRVPFPLCTLTWHAHLHTDGLAALASPLCSGSLRSLVSLHLSHNLLGAGRGVPALADGLICAAEAGEEPLPRLRELRLASNGLGEGAMMVLVSAIGAWALPAARTLALQGNPASDAPVQRAIRVRAADGAPPPPARRERGAS